MTKRLRLLTAGVLVLGACDSEDTATGDPVISTGCSSTVSGLQTFILGLLPATSYSAGCVTHAREISTGVTLGAASGQDIPWNALGGRGALMADAALCLLADLGWHGAEGAVVSQVDFSPFRTRQILGQTSFDPEARVWTGYQRIEMCAPLIECFDVARQEITAEVVSAPSMGTAGPFSIEDAYALRVTSEHPSLNFVASLGEYTIPTPIGPVTFEPTVTYGEALRTIGPPFDHVEDTLHYIQRNPQRLQDTNGRAAQGLIVSTHPASLQHKGGWVSQLGFGQRGPGTTGFSATGTEADRVRPDVDMPTYQNDIADSLLNFDEAVMSVPRNGAEDDPVMHLGIDATIERDLAPNLPFSLPPGFSIDEARVFIRPHAAVDFAGQTQLVVREGDPLYHEFDELPVTQVLMQSMSGATGEYGIEVGIDIDLSFPFGSIEIHESFEVPLLQGDDAAYGVGDLAYASSISTPDVEPALWSVHTLSGFDDEADMLLECFESAPPDFGVPGPTTTPWDEPLFDLFPCNICIHAEAGLDGSSPASEHWLLPFGAPAWICNVNRHGCMDLCRFDPDSGEFLEIERSAADDLSLCEPPPA